MLDIDGGISRTLFCPTICCKLNLMTYSLVWIKRKTIAGQSYLSSWGNFGRPGRILDSKPLYNSEWSWITSVYMYYDVPAPRLLLNRLFTHRSKKTSKLRVTGLCVGNSPRPVNSSHKWPVTQKMFPFDDVIMQFELVGGRAFAQWFFSDWLVGFHFIQNGFVPRK